MHALQHACMQSCTPKPAEADRAPRPLCSLFPSSSGKRAQAASGAAAHRHPPKDRGGCGPFSRLPDLLHRSRFWGRVRRFQSDGDVHGARDRCIHVAGRAGHSVGEEVEAHGAGAVLCVTGGGIVQQVRGADTYPLREGKHAGKMMWETAWLMW